MNDLDTMERAIRVARRGHEFLSARSASLEAAVVDTAWFDGDPQAIVDGLLAYQNDDGGFGRGLEVDIEAPQSNPFAACLALNYLRGVPMNVGADLRRGFGGWLRDNQADDGDWHFSAETKAGKLAPWFANWIFPSLNPACCVAGLAAANGLANADMLSRVHELFNDKASLATVRDGEFYDLTPYAEYSLTGALPPEYLKELTATIIRWGREDRFEDAEHFFHLALRNAPELAARMPADLVDSYVDRALESQDLDGGWPSPYDAAWRPAATVGVLTGLARVFGRSSA